MQKEDLVSRETNFLLQLRLHEKLLMLLFKVNILIATGGLTEIKQGITIFYCIIAHLLSVRMGVVAGVEHLTPMMLLFVGAFITIVLNWFLNHCR